MDNLKTFEIQGRVLDQGFKKAEEIITEDRPQYITKQEAEVLVKEAAEKSMQEVTKKLEEDAAGRTDFALTKDKTEHPPSYDEKDNVVVTSRSIVDKGNYTNIHRLGFLIAQTADLIVGEYSDLQSVVAEETSGLLKKYTAHLNEFVARL